MRFSVSTVFLSTILLLVPGHLARAGQTSAPVVWDTVGTGSVRLAVSNHGSMGLNGVGGANMDFTSSGLDCDPNATVYLNTGGLFIIQEVVPDTVYSFSTGMFQLDASSAISFQPDPTGPPPLHFVGPDGSDAFFTGRFLNWDSTIGMERTYYAPITGAPYDKFIVVRTDIYSLDGNLHEKLLIGEAIDWNIPTNPTDENRSWRCEGRVRGVQGASADSCDQNELRTGFGRVLGVFTSQDLSQDACENNSNGWLYNGTNWTNHLLPSLANKSDGGFIPSAIWDSLLIVSCTPAFADTGNLYELLSYAHRYSLQPDDTLTVFLAVESEMTYNLDQWADWDIEQTSKCWYQTHIRPGCWLYTCCTGPRGNIDFDPDDIVDIADLTALIYHLFIGFSPLPCPREGNVNGDPQELVDIADLVALIDHLFINFPPLPSCPNACGNSNQGGL